MQPLDANSAFWWLTMMVSFTALRFAVDPWQGGWTMAKRLRLTAYVPMAQGMRVQCSTVLVAA
jgi:hypothetical protein